MDTVSIIFETPEFLGQYTQNEINGFILKYKKDHYIISLHHNCPIQKIYEKETNIELNIFKNSNWSEVLVLSLDNINIDRYKIYSDFQNKFPEKDDIITLKDMRGIIIDIEYCYFDGFLNSPKIPYIKASIDSDLEDYQGLSGTPVFLKNKIIGLFSKYDIKNKIIYIIPIYIVIKNILKKDNNIYGYSRPITKINSYKVNDDYIYHSSIKQYIPLSTFILLEGDVNAFFDIYNDDIKILSQFEIINDELIVSHEETLIINKNKIKINFRLLTLLKKYNYASLKRIFHLISENKIKNLNNNFFIKIVNF